MTVIELSNIQKKEVEKKVDEFLPDFVAHIASPNWEYAISYACAKLREKTPGKNSIAGMEGAIKAIHETALSILNEDSIEQVRRGLELIESCCRHGHDVRSADDRAEFKAER